MHKTVKSDHGHGSYCLALPATTESIGQFMQ